MIIEAYGKTDVGMKRSHNEDSLLFLPEFSLFAVADGMGGHNSGEIASRIAVDSLQSFWMRTDKDPDATWPFKEEKHLQFHENRLATAIKLANKRIFDEAMKSSQYKGMGTTVVCCLYASQKLLFAHIGDSRGYQIRGGRIAQITQDHSLLNDFIRNNNPTLEEIKNFPHKNVIVRALGMREFVQVDLNKVGTKSGDRYVLCSDGLSGFISDEEILKIALAHDSPQGACDALVNAANAGGGGDNITVIVLHAVDEEKTNA